MQFALVGDHPDGLDMARALVASGRHELLVCNGVPAARRSDLPASVQPVGDFEEVLADPRIDLVIVAGPLTDRPAHLRRALQSERHVLCVYPPGDDPDSAYEAALIQGDTKKVLLPLMPLALHPAVTRLRDWLRERPEPFRLIHVERWSTYKLSPENNPTFADWNVLRALGGEIMELSAFAAAEEVSGVEPVLVSGRFEKGGLLQMTVLHGQSEPRWRLTVIGAAELATLTSLSGGRESPEPPGLTGSGTLVLHEATDALREEAWPSWDPGPELVRAFEDALTGSRMRGTSWQDAIHCLELDDAARRSIERRRASLLEYPEASEEVGFKGTMTLVGCGVLWGSLLLLIVANWFPAVGLIIAPILVLFLALQLLRWVIPKKDEQRVQK